MELTPSQVNYNLILENICFAFFLPNQYFTIFFLKFVITICTISCTACTIYFSVCSLLLLFWRLIYHLFTVQISDPTKASGQRLVGDVEFAEAKEVASYITPVPGGVGPMTVAMLMKNTVISAQRCAEKLMSNQWSLRNLPLNLKRPVPR